MRFKQVYEDLYKAPIYYICGCTAEQAKELLIKHGIPTNGLTWGIGHSQQIDYEDGNKVFIIWTLTTNQDEVFIHELYHITNFILGSRHVQFDFSNDEPFAYLIERLYKLLQHNDKKTKKRTKSV